MLAQPKVLVVGYCNRPVYWTENTAEGFRQAGCQVDYFSTSGRNPAHTQYLKWCRALIGDDSELLTRGLLRKMKRFRPDLIVFVLGAWLRESLFQAIEVSSPNVTKVAWVGDIFDPVHGVFAGYMDRIFCSDTYFIQLLRDHGCDVPSSYLPLAMDPRRFHPLNVPRTDKIVFVAKTSPGRSEFISQVRKPLTLYGKKWKKFKLEFNHTPHEIHAYNLPLSKMPKIYASCRAVLNIKNEIRVARGVNQRSFEPYGCMTPVLNDDVQDLCLCFELGSEILIYRSQDELDELLTKVAADPVFAQKIGLAGHRRVMAHHTFELRARSILKQAGLE